MIRERVPVGEQGLGGFRMAGEAFADQEKGRLDAALSEFLREVRGVFAGAVVDGEPYFVAPGVEVRDYRPEPLAAGGKDRPKQQAVGERRRECDPWPCRTVRREGGDQDGRESRICREEYAAEPTTKMGGWHPRSVCNVESFGELYVVATRWQTARVIYDVAIIGGGPAGATAANILSRRGRSVVVCEKEEFPRFKIGESLLPHSLRTLDELGVRPALDAHAFVKHGGEIATACGSRIRRFYFDEAIQLRDVTSYQVERAWFDKMMLARAAECGAEVRQPCAVTACGFDADTGTLATTAGDIRARYVLDCSGRNTVIGQHFDLKRRYEHLQKFSVFAHYTGVQRDAGRDGGITRLVRDKRHWFWLIPIDAGRTSVGMVCDIADFRAGKKTPEQALDDAIAASPLMAARMAGAARVTDVHPVGDYSYRNTRFHGPRWLLAGDAAGFIDPIFSTGVFVAIHSGEKAAAALDSVLRHPWQRGLRFPAYTRGLSRLMNRYLRFVGAWYTEEFVDVFTAPNPPCRIPQAVNSVLGGNVHPNFSVWWRLQLFYLVLWMQRRREVVPRFQTPDANASRVAAAG